MHVHVHVRLAVTDALSALFGRMTGIFYLLLRQRWDGTDTEMTESQNTKLKILPPLCRDSNPRPFDHESGALPLCYRRYTERESA